MNYRHSVRIDGVQKYTKLARCWKSIKARVTGKSTRSPHLYQGMELGFTSFAEFRTYALANGFTHKTTSPDREDPERGYVPGNLRFISASENFARRRNVEQSDYAVRGDEPPSYYDDDEDDEMDRRCGKD